MDYSHPGLSQVTGFLNNKKSKYVKQLFENGLIVYENLISKNECKKLIDDLNFLRDKYPYHIDNDNYAGVFRSPFIFFDSYRKLMLSKKIHDILSEVFPTNYQLHLSRCVENKATKSAATIEWHRDIPYLHSPSKFPLSISILTFLSNTDEIQIEIKSNSHDEYFYNYGDAKLLSLNPNAGDTLIFDSNLIHRTLPTQKTVLYNLYMFSSPVIKPVVNYTSRETISKIDGNKYKLEEVKSLLGYEYLTPKDDLEYMSKKI